MKQLILILGSNASGKTTTEKDVIRKLGLEVIEHIPKHHTLFNHNIISIGGNVPEKKTTSIDCFTGQAALVANKVIKEDIFNDKIVLAHWSLFTHKSYCEFLSHFDKCFIFLLNNSYHETINRAYKRRCYNEKTDLIPNGMLKRFISTVDRNKRLFDKSNEYHDNCELFEYVDEHYEIVSEKIISIIKSIIYKA